MFSCSARCGVLQGHDDMCPGARQFFIELIIFVCVSGRPGSPALIGGQPVSFPIKQFLSFHNIFGHSNLFYCKNCIDHILINSVGVMRVIVAILSEFFIRVFHSFSRFLGSMITKFILPSSKNQNVSMIL